MSIYKLEKHHCDCHPETCCCNDWQITKDDYKFVTIFDRKKAEIIVDALNIYSKK